MLDLRAMQQNRAAAANSQNSASATPSLSPLFQKSTGVRGQKLTKSPARLSRAELRVKRDVEELSKARYCVGRTVTRVNFPGGTSNLKQCMITVCPKEGAYDGAVITFELKIGDRYPFIPPTVTCHTRVFHPNIDWRNGKVSLGLLSLATWQPVLTINSVLFQLQTLFISPGSDLDNSINPEAKQVFLSDQSGRAFDQLVTRTVKGGHFFGVKWDSILAQNDALPSQPAFSRALSGGQAPVPHVIGRYGAKRTRGKRSRDDSSPDTQAQPPLPAQNTLQNPLVNGHLPQAPQNQRPKRRRDCSEFDSESKVASHNPDPASLSTHTKRSRMATAFNSAVPSQVNQHHQQRSVVDAFQQFHSRPNSAESAADLFDHVRHRAFLEQQRQKQIQQKLAQQQQPASDIDVTTSTKRARRREAHAPDSMRDHDHPPDALSAADRDFFVRGVQEARRSPVSPLHVFGAPATSPKNAAMASDHLPHIPSHMLDENRDPMATAAGPLSDPCLTSTNASYSHAIATPHSSPPSSSSRSVNSSTQRSPAQRSSFVPLLQSPDPRLASAMSAHSHQGRPASAGVLAGSSGASKPPAPQPHLSLSQNQHKPGDFSLSFSGVPSQAKAPAGFDLSMQHSGVGMGAPSQPRFLFGGAQTPLDIGVLGRSGSANMVDDEEDSGPCERN